MSPLQFSTRLPKEAAECQAAHTLIPVLARLGWPVRWYTGRPPLRWNRKGPSGIRVHFGWEGMGNPDLAVVFTPSGDRLDRFFRRHPAGHVALFAEMDPDALVTPDPRRDERISFWPFPIPDAFFAPGDGVWVHRVTEQLRLHHRPRLVYAGRYRDGAGLSRLFEICRSFLSRDGELILLDGLSHRAALAPVVHSLRLAERVIFAPPLSEEQTAGIFHGADLLIDPDLLTSYPYWMSYAQAAGLPTVALDGFWTRYASGRAALLVDPKRPDAWTPAVEEALTNTRLRESMIARAFAFAAPRRPKSAVGRWLETLERLERKNGCRPE